MRASTKQNDRSEASRLTLACPRDTLLKYAAAEIGVRGASRHFGGHRDQSEVVDTGLSRKRTNVLVLKTAIQSALSAFFLLL